MVRFALMGCGRIAKKHAEILTDGSVQNAKLIAICDSKPDRAKNFGEKYRVPHFTNIHELMSAHSKEIDVISILTPSGFHAKHCLEVISYKKHILVEKPMALTLSDADRMIAACDSAGIFLFVVKQNRHNIPVQKLKEALDAGRFGKLVLGTVRVRWCRDQAYYDQDSWRGKWEFDGGVFANQVSHHIDLLSWLMGPVESVFAKSVTALVNIEAEDTGAAIFKFQSGALGIVEGTTAARPRDLEGSLSLLGSGGTVEIDGFAVNQMKTWDFSNALPADKEILQKYKESPVNVYGFGHARYLQAVVNTIKKSEPPCVDGREGRKSLELILAIYESIELGSEIKFPFSPDHVRLGKPGT